MLTHALAYAARGWRVFPVWNIGSDGKCACGGLDSCDGGKHAGKHPIVRNGHKNASSDLDQVRRWWTRNPDANIGLSCKASGLFVVDCDPRNGSEETQATLRSQGHRFTSLVRAQTGGGGTHDYFASPPDGWRSTPQATRAGIDLKHNGYVILPPSNHVSGGRYDWISGHGPDVLDLVGDLPAVPECFTSDDPLPSAVGGEVPTGDAYSRLNTLALQNIPAWAPKAYPHGRLSTDNGWRVESVTLKRKFEEALVINPKGVQDFGPETKLTPIWLLRRDFTLDDGDLVRFEVVDWEEESRAPRGMSKDEAANWLAGRLGLDFAAMLAEDPDITDRFDEEDEDFAEEDDEDLIGPAPASDDDIGDIGKASKGKEIDWISRLDLNEEGAIKPTLHNVELIIRNDPRTSGIARLNAFTQEIVYRGEPGIKPGRSPKGIRQLDGSVWVLQDPVNGDLWSDSKDSAVRSVVEAPKRQGGYGIKLTDRDLKAAVDLSAQREAFHPVQEYLEGLKWDGRPRAERLFIDYLGAPDTSYIRSSAKLWLLGAVVRVFEPGHKFDFVPILEGLQGKRKSTFISILAKHWFAELDGDFHDAKQMIELMQGAWMLEIPELSGFGRADVRQIKAFVSRQKDKARLSYARRAQVFPRQCVFMGSTNDREYLRDDTGGRRFWPVECEVDEIDTDTLAQHVDQLWAETVAAYREMRLERPFGTLPLYLTDEDAKSEALRIQEDRRIESAEDALIGQIKAWLDKAPTPDFEDEDDIIGGPPPGPRDKTCLLEIWCECLGNDRRSYNQAASQTVGRAMRRMNGWRSATDRPYFERYGQQRCYIRED